MEFPPARLGLAVVLVLGLGLALCLRQPPPPREGESATVGMPPGEILFSLPTLCDALPPLERGAVGPDAFVLHEDDWRQIEFVPAHEKDEVLREVEDLRRFKREHWSGVGWTEVFVRSSRRTALWGHGLTRSQLLKVVPSFADRRPLALDTMGELVPVAAGFSLELSPGVVLYGHLAGDEVASLGIATDDPSFEETAAASTIIQIRERFRLELVDWYRSAVLG